MNIYNKFICSVCFFITCVSIMAICGDALAWFRMLKYDTIEDSKSHILNDVGFDLIVYSCPKTIFGNVQTAIIILSLVLYFVRCMFMINGLVYMQQFIHMSCIMMLLRTTTLSLTSMPNPNPKCFDESVEPIEYTGYDGSAFKTIHSVATKSCGNLMFSGHTMFLTMIYLFENKHKIVPRKLAWLSFVKTATGYYYIISCRSHYTIDVWISFLITNMTFQIYNTYDKSFFATILIERDEESKPMIDVETIHTA